MSVLQPRVAAMASTFAAGSVVASAALFGGVPMTPLHTGGILDRAQHDIMLASADDAIAGIAAGTTSGVITTIKGSMQYLLDDLLGIGTKTPGELVGGVTTLQQLLVPSGLGVDSTMTDVFNAVGLQNIQIGGLLHGLFPNGDSLDQILTQAGLANTTLDSLMSSAGLPGSTTIADLVDKLGMGTQTVAQLMTSLGFNPSTVTMGTLMQDLGLGKLEGLLGLVGMTPSGTLGGSLGMMFGGSNFTSLTLDDLMHAAPTTGAVAGDGFLSSIGDMTLGGMLGITSGSTLKTVIDGMTWHTASGVSQTFGQYTLSDLLGGMHITSATTLAGLLGEMPFGLAGNTLPGLGGDTLAQVIGEMMNHGTAITSTFTLADFLDGLLGTTTIDQLLGLT